MHSSSVTNERKMLRLEELKFETIKYSTCTNVNKRTMYIQITNSKMFVDCNSDGIEAKDSKESAPSEIQDSRSVLRRLKCSDLIS